MTYEEAVHYIEEIPKFTKKNKAGNTRQLLSRLGNPEEAFRVIHVAGTNGKGSVCAFLSSLLQEGGYRTGLFTSPHLVTINERFQIDRVMITDEELLSAFETVMEAVHAMMEDGYLHPTYFELLFAMGMVAFRERKIDWLVMETGLGGRLDATNTVRRPAACVITSISLDHTEYLGNTIPEIAGEKAGIIKEGVPVIYDGTDRSAEAVILRKAEQMHAPAAAFYPQMAQITGRDAASISYVLNNRWFDYCPVTVPFAAEYQVANSALAMMTMRILDMERKLTDHQMEKAVAAARWSGRMQQILPGVILDGAHNADGIEQFTKTVREMAKLGPVSLLFAAVSDKDYRKMIQELAQCAPFTSITVTRTGGDRQVDPEVFAKLFREFTDTPVYAAADAREAFEQALARKAENEVLFCAGSLYLVGELIAAAGGRQVQKH